MQLHLERTGSGSPVVLTHGLGDDSATFGALAPLLAGAHAVTSWDLRGHGRSDAPPDPASYSLEIGVADLSGVIDGAGAPVHLVGHSLGGFLSLVVALRRPELVRSLTLIASGPGYRDAEARDAWNSYVGEAVLKMPVPAVVAGLAKQHDSWVIDHVADLRPPLLLVIGERDTRFQPGMTFLTRAVTASASHEVAGAGHHPQRSHATDVAALMLDHLAAADRLTP